jgi:hypothetical protein
MIKNISMEGNSISNQVLEFHREINGRKKKAFTQTDAENARATKQE